MEKNSSQLTVLFDDPFWVGIFECIHNNQYEVSKFTFYSKPSDVQIYEFVLFNYSKLSFSEASESENVVSRHINPKRMQRLINKQLRNSTITTKAQQALKIQQEQRKLEKKCYSKEQKLENKKRKFVLKTKKRIEKHKGH